MTSRISRCHACSESFDSKRKLKEHIDKNHRITDSKIIHGGPSNKKSSNNLKFTTAALHREFKYLKAYDTGFLLLLLLLSLMMLSHVPPASAAVAIRCIALLRQIGN